MEKDLYVGVNKKSKLVKIESDCLLTKDETLTLIDCLKKCVDMISD